MSIIYFSKQSAHKNAGLDGNGADTDARTSLTGGAEFFAPEYEMSTDDIASDDGDTADMDDIVAADFGRNCSDDTGVPAEQAAKNKGYFKIY